MKRVFKSVLSITLAFIFSFSVMPFSGMITAQATEIWQQPVGTIITYGSYPQSRVTNSSLTSALDTASAKYLWHSYGYYTGSGSRSDGQMTSKDYMSYKDFAYNGSTYRAVTFTQYRPYCTGYTSSSNYTYQEENGYTPNNVYYFKYEPLKWRILDPGEGLVMCENIIDSQAYNNYFLSANAECWGDSAKTYYASNWAKCSLRQWLNDDFYNTAFSSTEKSAIKASYLENKSTYSSVYDAPSTYDKVFLLSYWDMINSNYGFSSSEDGSIDTARRGQGSDYAKCQGLDVYRSSGSSYYGNSTWRLRSPYRSYGTGSVSNDGLVDSGYFTDLTFSGVRPALKFNPKSSIPNGDFENVPVTFVADGKVGRVDVDFRQSWFENNSSEYNHNLAQLCSQFVMLGYDRVDGKQPNLEKALKDIGMEGIETKPNAGQEEVNYFIANRKITVGSKEYTLIFAGFIGSYHAQWYSNFDPGTGETHKGFNNAKNYVMGKLNSYINALPTTSKSNVKILICGHSRGAATANLVAADLIKNEQYAYKDNIYTYAFATPNSTTSPERKEAQYKRIFNIVNPEDFVTKVMLVGWGYGRYGTTYVLPSLTNTKNSKYKTYYNNMQKYYSDFSAGEKYTPYGTGEAATYKVVTELYCSVPTVSKFYSSKHHAGIFYLSPYDFFHNTLCHFVSKVASSDEMALAYSIIGETILNPKSNIAFRDILLYFILGGLEIGDFTLDHKFVEAHSANTYCAYTMSMSEKQMKEERKGYLNAVNCPVDVEVYDKETEELVGRIVNNVVDEEIAAKDNSVVMVVDGDKKEFWLPSDGNYEVKLIGNDNGTMDYSVAEINEDSAEVQKVNFFDVPIENGKAYEAEINEITTLDDYTIESPTGNDVAPTENMMGDDIISYNINVSTEGDGYATNGITVTSGERVTLEASPKEGANFLGWYENGKKISSESTIDFVAKSDRNITAKFSEKVLPSVKGVSIGNFSIDYKSSKTITPNITADEGASYTVTYKSSNPSVATVDGNGKVTSQKQSGFNRGSTVITCTVTDSIGNTVSDTCKVSVQYAWWQWLIKIVLLGFIWY